MIQFLPFSVHRTEILISLVACIPPRGRIKGTARAIYSILPQLQGNMEYIAALGQYGIYCCPRAIWNILPGAAIYCPGADIV